MNTGYDAILNVLYQRQITSREQLLKEILRVKITQSAFSATDNILADEENLFQCMKLKTENELGFFPADRADFLKIYESLKNVDLIGFTLEIYKEDRVGVIQTPEYLVEYITERVKRINPKRLLITDAEKHLRGLKELVECFPESDIVLTTQNKIMYHLLLLLFGSHKNVQIKLVSIYRDTGIIGKFDYVFTLPLFGQKPEEFSRSFITRDSDGIALENMLDHLSISGVLDIILPAKITFAGIGYEKLRSHIKNNYFVENIFILPEGIFKPSIAIKTYLFTIAKTKKSTVTIGTFDFDKNSISITDKKTFLYSKFLSHEDWRIEFLLADDDENIRKFKNSSIKKARLGDIAEVFRGKSILKKDTSIGRISVLNISDIENGEINYRELDSIDEDERKVKRYELQTNDVVLSCRGTAVKSAVFENQGKVIIASANLVVIRPLRDVEGAFIKIFLESPIGTAIIKSFQRGTTVMNINYLDVMEMDIPLLPLDRQQRIISKYYEKLKIFKEITQKADEEWKNERNMIYNEFV